MTARGSERRPGSDRGRPSKAVLALLLVASFTVITLDARGGDDSPVEPMRAAAGDVFGPVERAADTVVRPFAAIPRFLRTTGGLQRDLRRLEAENAVLRGQLAATDLDRRRVAEVDGLLAASKRAGYALVPARVVAMGPMQSFSRTVTIDAGTSSGVQVDRTVLNDDGLVGRVVQADRSTSTVLLIVDAESVVGGRLGRGGEVGFVRGRGDVGERGRLDLDLVDNAVTPDKGDVVVTWGSKHGAPYVSGVPIGRVHSVISSPRDLSKRAVVDPFVDFAALDVVGVAVDPDTESDRAVFKAGGAR